MYQVTFSDQSMSELNTLSADKQMLLIEQLSNFDPKDSTCGTEDIGQFNREGTIFYRLRPLDLRVYFEIKSKELLYCHYILKQHSFKDFLFRFKLPVTDEQMIEEEQSFWKYLETLKK